MNKQRVSCPSIGFMLVLCWTVLACGSAWADLTILPIGDSITSGLSVNNNKGLPSRGSYRPHLSQQIDFFLNTGTNNPNNMQVDFLGTPSPGNDGPYQADNVTPLEVTGIAGPITGWTDIEHMGRRGEAVNTHEAFDQTGFTTTLNALPTVDVAMIMLGTNDMFPANNSNPLAINAPTRLSVAERVFEIVDTLINVNSNVEVLVGAIPPIDSRASSLFWTEASRGSDLDGDNLQDSDVNDIIDAINTELQSLALGHSGNVRYVDTRAATTLRVDNQGNTQQISSFDSDLSDNNGESTHLLDGVHPNDAGDMVIAGNFFDALQPILALRASAQAVPEPSSFILFGAMAVAAGVRRRWFCG